MSVFERKKQVESFSVDTSGNLSLFSEDDMCFIIKASNKIDEKGWCQGCLLLSNLYTTYNNVFIRIHKITWRRMLSFENIVVDVVIYLSDLVLRSTINYDSKVYIRCVPIFREIVPDSKGGVIAIEPWINRKDIDSSKKVIKAEKSLSFESRMLEMLFEKINQLLNDEQTLSEKDIEFRKNMLDLMLINVKWLLNANVLDVEKVTHIMEMGQKLEQQMEQNKK